MSDILRRSARTATKAMLQAGARMELKLLHLCSRSLNSNERDPRDTPRAGTYPEL